MLNVALTKAQWSLNSRTFTPRLRKATRPLKLFRANLDPQPGESPFRFASLKIVRVLQGKMVLPDRIELSTSSLPMKCSTTELRQQTPHQSQPIKSCAEAADPCHKAHRGASTDARNRRHRGKFAVSGVVPSLSVPSIAGRSGSPWLLRGPAAP